MKKATIALALLLSVGFIATGQEKQPSSKPKSTAQILEAKVRTVWEDFKKKDKASLAAMLDDNFREVEEGGSGFGDKKAELAMVDEFEITTYTLKDFEVKSLGPNSALVTYHAHYEGKAGNEAVNSNSAFGEIWIRVGNDWKGVYAQETALK